MTDLHDMRARMRETGYQAAAPSRGGMPFWIVTVCAVAVGFTVVLFVPRFYTAERTAALPTFKDTGNREQPSAPAQIVAPEIAALRARLRYSSVDQHRRHRSISVQTHPILSAAAASRSL